DVHTPVEGIPVLQYDDVEEEGDWEDKLREAKARATAPPPAAKPAVATRPLAPIVAAAKVPEPIQKLELRKPARSKKIAAKKPEPPKNREPTLTGIPTPKVSRPPDWMEDDWSAVINRAKEKSARAAASPRKEEEDWDALIRRAKTAAV